MADMVALAGLDTGRLLREGEWFSRYEYAAHWWRRPLVIATVPTGGKSSDYFQQENRWKCDSINSPSPYRTWHTKQFLTTLLSALWSLKCTKVNNSVLRSCIGLRKYIASQFRPTAAKAIYDHYKAERVLDFSSGWGDRLVGFMASESRHYIGVDPSESVHEGYRSYLREFQRTDATTDLRHGTAETQMYEPNSVDLVFTSPPYFNIEHYDGSSSQSYRKHPKLDAWLEAFLFEAIRRAWGALRVGGHMVINISDVYSNHRIHRICDPMNAFISTLRGATYEGAIGYTMHKRPNSGALKGRIGTFAEPMWVWGKCK